MRILVVEDAPRTSRLMFTGLTEEGYAVECVADGPTGLNRARSGQFDLVLLDLNLPGMDGLELLRLLRQTRSDLPVIIVSARDTPAERVAGLDAGADDYLVKEFSFDELLARIRAVARRPGARQEPILVFGDVVLDPAQGKARRGERPLDLSAREYSLLRVFLKHPGQVITRTRLYESVWNIPHDGSSNVLDVFVSHLRNKLEEAGEPRIIHTLRGRGYRLGEES